MFGVKKGSWEDDWPHHRSPYVRVGLIVAAVHLLLFVFAPPFHFKPYRLEAQEVMIVEEVSDFELRDLVPDEPELPRDVEPAPDEWGVDIDPRWDVFRRIDKLPQPPREKGRATTGFIHVDRQPVPTRLVKPVYPDLAREAGIEGVVMVKVWIDETGTVTAVEVQSSDVTDAMNRAAIEAAWRCKFEPAKQRDKPVPVVVVIPFEFRLENH